MSVDPAHPNQNKSDLNLNSQASAAQKTSTGGELPAGNVAPKKNLMARLRSTFGKKTAEKTPQENAKLWTTFYDVTQNTNPTKTLSASKLNTLSHELFQSPIKERMDSLDPTVQKRLFTLLTPENVAPGVKARIAELFFSADYDNTNAMLYLLQTQPNSSLSPLVTAFSTRNIVPEQDCKAMFDNLYKNLDIEMKFALKEASSLTHQLVLWGLAYDPNLTCQALQKADTPEKLNATLVTIKDNEGKQSLPFFKLYLKTFPETLAHLEIEKHIEALKIPSKSIQQFFCEDPEIQQLFVYGLLYFPKEITEILQTHPIDIQALTTLKDSSGKTLLSYAQENKELNHTQSLLKLAIPESLNKSVTSQAGFAKK